MGDGIENRAEPLYRVANAQNKLQDALQNVFPEQHCLLQLVKAEHERVLNNKLSAIDLYDSAVANARTSNAAMVTALSCELAARFYVEWGKKSLAIGYLIEAHHCYQQLGASEKALEQLSEVKLLSNSSLRLVTGQDAKFQQLVEQAADVIWSVDLDWNFTYLSPQFETLFGFNPDECLGNKCFDYIHPDDNSFVIESARNLSNGNPSKNQEFRHLCSNGNYIWVMVRAAPVFDSDSHSTGLQGIIRDISERKSAEIALNEAQDRFRRITDNVPGMIYRYIQRVDGRDEFLYLGPQCGDMFEVEATNAIKDPDLLYQFFHPSDLKPFSNKINESAISLSQFRMEFRLSLPIQGLCWRQAISEPSLTPDGNIIWDGIVTDITAEKNSKLQLQTANEQLAKAAKMKDNFLATISHELRTPLTAILGMNDGLKNGFYGPITDEQANSLEVVQESGKHLLELINEVLDMTKIESGSMTLLPSTIDIGKLCDACLRLVSQQANTKTIALHKELPFDLPTLKADEKRLRQILVNLLGNALKFTETGGEVTLSVKHTKPENTDDEYLRFSVTDTGIGIENSAMKDLFEPFSQVQSSLNRDYNGIGLGLALVKRFTELHSGKIGVDSQPGKGSCFYIELPCSLQTTTGIKQSFESPGNNKTDVQHSRTQPSRVENSSVPLVILAEDNEAVAKATKRFLEYSNFRVHRVTNGDAAVQAAKDYQPEIVLMDIQMPRSDGIDAIKKLRNIQSLRNTPIVALTGLTMEDDRKRCLDAGADHYLCKPYRMQELVDLIRQLLQPARQDTLVDS